MNKPPFITLSDNNKIPQLGYGVYMIETDEETEKCVSYALKVGYRHIDTAHVYRNERGVGAAIKKSGIPREEIFITSKLFTTDFGEGKTSIAIDQMLKRLDTNYIDLLLIHVPYGDYLSAWKEMEKGVKDGKIKSIGISNFETENIDEIYSKATIKPVIDQIELHPYCQHVELRKKLDKLNIKIEGFCPLTHATTDLLKEDFILKCAEKYKKSPAQIVLRWHIQSGFIVIPKSVREEKIKENFEIFDFELSKEDFEEINKLDGKVKRIQDFKELEEFVNQLNKEGMFD